MAFGCGCHMVEIKSYQGMCGKIGDTILAKLVSLARLGSQTLSQSPEIYERASLSQKHLNERMQPIKELWVAVAAPRLVSDSIGLSALQLWGHRTSPVR